MHRLTFDQSSVACSWAGYENALYSCSSTTPAPLVSFTPGRDRLFSSTAVSACRRNQDMSSTFRLMLLLGFPLGMIAFVDLPAMYLQSPDAMTKSHITEPGELAPSAPTKETYEYVDPTDDQIRSLQQLRLAKRGMNDYILVMTVCGRSKSLCQKLSPAARYVVSNVEVATCTCQCATAGNPRAACRLTWYDSTARNRIIWNKM
ncbi:hypothetical protein LSAT2_010408 [Lamellibrachia satsuma]|nr:hypothetical protein LSAT2_010408 [Lamellibrachia satsuma]